MNAFQAVILGLIQGLTEFLPVSSSGHLVVFQTLFGIEEDMMVFDIFVHLGTLVAVFVSFWKDIWQMLKKPVCKFMGMLIVACIPTGIMGWFLDDFFEQLFSSITAVAIALIITGILLMISDKFDGTKTIDEMKITDALVIGTVQGCAITPGLSRSGTSIFGALACGMKREDAAKFSFILSIPVILAAVGKSSVESLISIGPAIEWTYFLAAAVAAASGYIAIKVFIKLLHAKRMRYFSYYVWAVALAIIVSRFFV